MSNKPLISIVVPAYNEEFGLKECLSALKSQDYPGAIEIIVANNASTDRTPDIAREMGCRVVNEPRKGYVHALRAGFSAANGEIICCTDADTLVPQTWVSRIERTLSKPGVVACSGSFLFSDGSWWIRLIGWAFGRCNWHLAGANMAVRKDAFWKAGGFDPQVNMGADVELGFRLKKVGTVLIDKKLIAFTSARRFQLAFWRTIFRYYINDLFLILFRRPLFHTFANYRLSPRGAFAPASVFQFGVPLFMMVLLVGLTQSPTNQLLGSVFAHGGKAPEVALTFDDGPSQFTEQVLDILKQQNVPATFFLVGKNVQRYPDLVRTEVADGHAIGNHTFTHPLWSAIRSSAELSRQLDMTREAIRSAHGPATVFFRPPHGWRTPWMIRECDKKGYKVVTWTIDPLDWTRPSPSAIVHRILARVKPGSIILLHDGLETHPAPIIGNTVTALSIIISELKKRGYRFVTVPELYAEWEQTAPHHHLFDLAK